MDNCYRKYNKINYRWLLSIEWVLFEGSSRQGWEISWTFLCLIRDGVYLFGTARPVCLYQPKWPLVVLIQVYPSPNHWLPGAVKLLCSRNQNPLNNEHQNYQLIFSFPCVFPRGLHELNSETSCEWVVRIFREISLFRRKEKEESKCVLWRTRKYKKWKVHGVEFNSFFSQVTLNCSLWFLYNLIFKSLHLINFYFLTSEVETVMLYISYDLGRQHLFKYQSR